jgi:hypothetical protein
MTDLEFLDQAERLLAGVEISSDRLNDDTDAGTVGFTPSGNAKERA